MEFKGTKGKWKINRNNIPDFPEAEFEIEGDNMQVAISFDYNDARLIAAAPELLETLQLAFKLELRNFDDRRDFLIKAKTVIDKVLK